MFSCNMYYVLRLETAIDSQKIIPHDSPLREADRLIQKYFWKVSRILDLSECSSTG